MTEDRKVARWAQRFVCPNEAIHGCDPCKACGEVRHVYGDEPYCENCGLPHEGFFGAIKRMIGFR